VIIVEKAWTDNDFPPDQSFEPLSSLNSTLENYFAQQSSGCTDGKFEFISGSTLCWGGYVIIGIIIAVVVIIVIVIGVSLVSA